MSTTTSEGCVVCGQPVKSGDARVPEYVVCEEHYAAGAYNAATYRCPICGRIAATECVCWAAWLADYGRAGHRRAVRPGAGRKPTGGLA